MVTLVEGQKDGRRTGKLRRHVDFAVAHPQNAPAPRLESSAVARRPVPSDRRIAVEPILVDGVINALREVRLEFSGGDREAR
jgi:hypothetical protein